MTAFEDDRSMSVIIRDSGGVGGQEKGFPAKEAVGLLSPPQEGGLPSCGGADNVSAFGARLQESCCNVNQGEAVRKSLWMKRVL